MDSKFLPYKFAVQHSISHKFIPELVSYIATLVRGHSNHHSLVVIKCSFDLAQAIPAVC